MRGLKSVALIVLVLATSLRADDSGVLVPLVKNKFVHNPKQIKKYIEDKLTAEMEQLNKDKKNLKRGARKRVLIRSKRLKRELTVLQRRGVVPKSFRKQITESRIGFVDTDKNARWVRVVSVINNREFVATIGYQKKTIRMTRGSFAGFTRTNIQGTTLFRFIGFDTSHVRVNHSYQLQGFFKTTGMIIEPFVPNATGSPQGKRPPKKTKRRRGNGKGQN